MTSSFREELARALDAARSEERERFGGDVLDWLTVVPAWPESLAKRGFPGELSELGPELEKAGLVQHVVMRTEDQGADTHWWMPSAVRRELVASMHKRDAGQRIFDTAVGVATHLLQSPEELSQPLLRWATLAREPWNAARVLRAKISESIAAARTGEALGWIESARIAAEVLGGALENSAALGERQVELAYRREHDLRLLETFLERPEQTGWITSLLDGPDDLWALHLLGVGGVGKTMLIRYVMARLAPERRIVAVKIDFDHLSPDYPVRRPGQLIAALAEELSFHAETQHLVSYFMKLDDELATLDEIISAELTPFDPLANVRRLELDSLIDVLAEILGQIPVPVLLILDTCEELAKLRLAGGAAKPVPQPAVSATFTILESLQRRCPRLRVLFAGRRFLASEGNGWRPANAEAEQAVALLARPYLRLEELRGFDEREAASLLAQRFSIEIDATRRQAILDRSPELSEPRVERPGSAIASEVKRYHPFDLALYARWLQDSPSLDLASLASEGDPYVEVRVIGRIESEKLRSAVPTLTLLRRFNRAMAAAVFDIREDALSELLRLAGEQEWIDVQPDDESDGWFHEVHRSLWPRLVSFFATEPRRGEREAAARVVGPRLAAFVRELEPSKLRAEHLDAALRTLGQDAATTLWGDVELRASSGEARQRLLAICERLLAEGGAAEAGTLRPVVLSTYAGLQSSVAASGDLAACWSEVRDDAKCILDRPLREWLLARAVAAQVSLYRDNPLQLPTDLEEPLIALAESALAVTSPWPGSPLLAFREATKLVAIAAAVETLLLRARALAAMPIEQSQGQPVNRRSFDFAMLVAVADALTTHEAPLDIRTTYHTLAARVAAHEGNWEAADQIFERAVGEADGADIVQRTAVLDVPWPDSLGLEVRLEWASLDPLHSMSFRYDHKAQDRTGAKRRLIAHNMLVELAHGRVLVDFHSGVLPGSEALGVIFRANKEHALFSSVVSQWSSDALRDTELAPVSSSSAGSVPAPFVAAARSLAALGQFDRALAVLEGVIDAALKTTFSTHVIDAAEEEKLRLLRRTRQAAGDLPHRHAARFGHNEGTAYLELFGLKPGSATDRIPKPSSAARADRTNLESTVRGALLHCFESSDWRAWLDSLPCRFVAELALEEGENLARLDARRAAELLYFACQAFKKADDPVGTMFAATLRVAATCRVEGRASAQTIWEADARPALEVCHAALDWQPLGSPQARVTQSSWDPWRARLEAWDTYFRSGTSSRGQEEAFRHEFPSSVETVNVTQLAEGPPHGARAWSASRPGDELSANEAAAPANEPEAARPLLISVRPLSRGEVEIRVKGHPPWKVPVPAEGSAYSVLTESLPRDLPALLEMRASPDVEIEVGAKHIARWPWEALLPNPDVRVLRVLRPVHEGRVRQPNGAVGLFVSRRWSSLVAAGLNAAELHLLSSDVVRSGWDGPAVLVGTPVETRAGIVFRIAGDDGERQTSFGASREGRLLRPGTDGVLTAPVVVLVSEPAEAHARSVTQRKLASLMRGLAHDVAHGAGVVLSLPALPEAATFACLQRVATWLRSGAEVANREAVSAIAAELRARIRDDFGVGPSDEDRCEAAIDVVLYRNTEDPA